jgi:hypothetical protein
VTCDLLHFAAYEEMDPAVSVVFASIVLLRREKS